MASARKMVPSVPNVVRLPSAAARKVDNYRYADQRRAAVAARKASPFADRYQHHQDREAERLAVELTGIDQSPALLIVSAMIRTMDADAITRVLEQLAPGAVCGSKPHREAVATIKASRLNVGQQFDLMRAFKRLRGEG